MEKPQSSQILKFGQPAVYRIAVQAQVDQCTATEISDALIESGDSHATTLLVRVMDQAGLTGAIETLHGFHLPILSIELVTDK